MLWLCVCDNCRDGEVFGVMIGIAGVWLLRVLLDITMPGHGSMASTI